jgi:hypothetical protein
MHMTVELTGNDAPLTEKSQTEYIELEEGTVSDFKLKHRDIRVAGDTTVYTLIGEASMPFGGTIKKIQTISVDRRFPGHPNIPVFQFKIRYRPLFQLYIFSLAFFGQRSIISG